MIEIKFVCEKEDWNLDGGAEGGHHVQGFPGGVEGGPVNQGVHHHYGIAGANSPDWKGPRNLQSKSNKEGRSNIQGLKKKK